MTYSEAMYIGPYVWAFHIKYNILYFVSYRESLPVRFESLIVLFCINYPSSPLPLLINEVYYSDRKQISKYLSLADQEWHSICILINQKQKHRRKTVKMIWVYKILASFCYNYYIQHGWIPLLAICSAARDGTWMMLMAGCCERLFLHTVWMSNNIDGLTTFLYGERAWPLEWFVWTIRINNDICESTGKKIKILVNVFRNLY